MAKKAKDAFRTISEVADWLDVPAHVLRFWESRFVQIKPVKRAGGRRYYRPSDMRLIGGIKILLHDEGLTIRGVQRMIREDGVRSVSNLSPEIDMPNEEEAAARRIARRQKRWEKRQEQERRREAMNAELAKVEDAELSTEDTDDADIFDDEDLNQDIDEISILTEGLEPAEEPTEFVNEEDPHLESEEEVETTVVEIYFDEIDVADIAIDTDRKTKVDLVSSLVRDKIMLKPGSVEDAQRIKERLEVLKDRMQIASGK